MKLLHIFILYFFLFTFAHQSHAISHPTWWSVQSIDTMKYSRDAAREKLRDPTFDSFINSQALYAAEMGATHLAIGTPYDEEFLPYLKRWVHAARGAGLKVWFRGNWAGWEGWFNYPKISRTQHLQKTQNFVASHPELFEDNDIFTACPECENGGPGDPRINRDLVGHRNFLIQEHEMLNNSFQQIGKNVTFNYNSMNLDVAKLVMDRNTTAKLGGIVTVDHYIRVPDQFATDLRAIAETSGGDIILGEFGAPIPDIVRFNNEEEQAAWMDAALRTISYVPEVKGINYWVLTGGSTELISFRGQAKKAVGSITNYFKPRYVQGKIISPHNKPVPSAIVSSNHRQVLSNDDGTFTLPYLGETPPTLHISATNYKSTEVRPEINQPTQIVVERTQKDFLTTIQESLANLLRPFYRLRMPLF